MNITRVLWSLASMGWLGLAVVGTSCSDGKTTTGCDDDACSGVTCEHGRCVVDAQAPLCLCNAGYATSADLLSCQAVVVGDECEGITCNDLGTCMVVRGDPDYPICRCDAGSDPVGNTTCVSRTPPENPVDPWQTRATPPAVGTLVSCGNRLFLVGSPATTMWEYLVTEDRFEVMTPPAGTDELSMVEGAFDLAGSAYLVIGTRLLELNCTTATWTERSAVEQVSDAAYVSANGFGYVIAGGWVSMFATIYPTAHRYDPATDTWTALPDLPLGGTLDGVAVNVGSRIIFGGGFRGDAAFATVTETQSLDLDTQTWEAPYTVSPLRAPRASARSFTYAGQVYIGLGYLRTGAASSAGFTDFFRYDAADDAWRNVTPVTLATDETINAFTSSAATVGTRAFVLVASNQRIRLLEFVP